MQRLRNLVRTNIQTQKEESSSVEANHRKLLNCLDLNSDLIFLCAPFDKRIAELINYKKSTPIKSMTNPHHRYTATHLEYSSHLPFDFDLRFYTHLAHLRVVGSRKLHLSSFNNRLFQHLILDSVQTVETASENFSVQVLELANMTVDPSTLIAICRGASPSTLILRNTGCSGISPSEFYHVCSALSGLGLACLEVINSFLDFETFRRLVTTCSIRQYAFIYDNIEVVMKIKSTGVRFCKPERELSFHGAEDFETIEGLTLSAPENKLFLTHEMPHLKYLKLENIVIDSSFAKTVRPLRGLLLINCTFRNLSFYDMFRKLSPSLRFVRFHNTEIPLDSGVFLRNTLSRCQVVISETISFYVDEKSSK